MAQIANDLMKDAKELLARREYKQAQTLLEQAIEANPKNSEAYFQLANIFNNNGEIGKAIKAFGKVLEIDPCHTDAAISLSILYNDIGRYEEGKRIFDQANERVKNVNHVAGNVEDKHINKKFSLRHSELGDLYMTYNRYDDALFEYNKACSLDPINLEIRIKVAKVYARKGFTAKAFDELKRLKTEHPDYNPGRVALGVLYYGTGHVIEAQNEWQKVLAREPNHADAQMYLNLSRTATETTLS